MKKIALFFFILFAITCVSATAATTPVQSIQVAIYPQLDLYVKGQKDAQDANHPGMFFDGDGWVPKTMIYQGTTYVPLRYFSGKLGVSNDKIGWDGNQPAIWINSSKPEELKGAAAGSAVKGSLVKQPGSYPDPYKLIEATFYSSLTLYVDGIKDAQDGQHPGLFFDGDSWVPKTLIYQGTTYVPLRYFSSKLGIPSDQIGWDHRQPSIWIGSEKPDAVIQNKADTLYGVALGDTEDDVTNILGKPDRVDPSDMAGMKYWAYTDGGKYTKLLSVIFLDGKVVKLFSNSSSWKYNNASFGMAGQSFQGGRKGSCGGNLVGGKPCYSLAVTDRPAPDWGRLMEIYVADDKMFGIELTDYNGHNNLNTKYLPLQRRDVLAEDGYTLKKQITSPETRTGIEHRLFDMVNALRANKGKQPFIWSDRAQQAAHDQSTHMVHEAAAAYTDESGVRHTWEWIKPYFQKKYNLPDFTMDVAYPNYEWEFSNRWAANSGWFIELNKPYGAVGVYESWVTIIAHD